MNRLQYETSPYLRQHKNNPVDWYPWGDEALAQAKQKDKPILLSIGYSTCHWCHVMAHESFEDDDTAQIMNTFFVNIKVDREERPDVDTIYMEAVQTLIQHGGWPMTVFLLPDGRPFHGGTYYPKEARTGMPSFKQIMLGVHDAFQNRRAEVENFAENLTKTLNRDVLDIGDDADGLNRDLIDNAILKISQNFDHTSGGFGGAPKFPQPMNLEFLLRAYVHTRDKEILHMVTHTLEKMARGGIYDQIGGGFARYSVDATWLVPHFEKMLYDNAQLSRIYLHTWQVTKNTLFKNIAEDIYDYILRELAAPGGGFYSAADADSEGEEGKFFVWDRAEVEALLSEEDAKIAIDYWGMTHRGNFEGYNILHVPNDVEIVAERLSLSPDNLQMRLTTIKDTLYAARTHRVHPALDDKILASWNGLMLASLAEAARILDRNDYLSAAVRTGEFILSNFITQAGRIYRTYKDGESKLNGYLEDYANLIDAFLELYQSTFDVKWFQVACDLADTVLTHFTAHEGGFFDTSDDHERLIVRPRNLQDNAMPSGNSMMAKQLLRLAAYTGNQRYDEAARNGLRLITIAMREYPQAFAEALNAVDMLVMGLSEIAIVGELQAEDTIDLLSVIKETYRPNMIVALVESDTEGGAIIPLLKYRVRHEDKATVYICQNFACKLPVTTPDEMRALL